MDELDELEAMAVEEEMATGPVHSGYIPQAAPAQGVPQQQQEEVKAGGMTEEEKELEALMM